MPHTLHDRIYLLSMDHPDIGVEEVLRLCRAFTGETPQYELAGDILFVKKAPSGLGKRLAYAKSVHRIIAILSSGSLRSSLKSISWQKHCAGKFKAAIYKSRKFQNIPVRMTGRELGSIIYASLDRPRVDLENPDTTFTLFVAGKNIYVALLEEKVPADFMLRRAHLRPVMHPSSIHPRLAKAAANLTGILSGTIMDPFCGTGGILVEAGLLGFSVKGCDIRQDITDACKKNLAHYGITGRIFSGDALEADLSCDAIITDIPYGRNTALFMNALELVNRFLARQTTARSMVLMVPDTLPAKKLQLSEWKLDRTFTYYIHKSLTKKILLLHRD